MVISLLAFPPHAYADLSIKFDRFKGRTFITAPATESAMADANRGRLTVQAMTFFPGEKPTAAPPFVRLAFRVVSKNGWQYLRCHHVDALVDGSALALPQSKHTGDAISGAAVFESISVDLPWPKFVALSRAKVVEFRVCNTELRVAPERLGEWRDLVRASTPDG